jgi:hypothetical protein
MYIYAWHAVHADKRELYLTVTGTDALTFSHSSVNWPYRRP